MMKPMLFATAALMTGALALPQAAQAAPSACDAVAGNLVVNCGFETGNFTGYARSGNGSGTGVSSVASFVHSGNFGAFLGPIGSDGTLSQTLATIPGDTYGLTYFHFYSGSTPSDFSVMFAGQTFDATVNATSPMTYTLFTDDAVATSALTTLTFSFRDDVLFQGLDDISVVDLSRRTVPEPASLALLGAGLLGLAGARFRRGR